MDVVLEVEDLRKSYATRPGGPRRQALSGLSFGVPRGSVVGLLGPNGAGKTTTLKCVMGLARPDAGRVSIFGRDGDTVEARRRVGFLPEQPYFDLYLTPRKLLRYYGRLSGMGASAARARISYLLNLVGMEDDADVTMDKFSKGMLQRIGLAQALLAEPELLILDEPSSGLDPLGKLQVRDMLKSLSAGGTTILLSSHQLSEIEEICDRVIVIHRGREVASGELAELLEEEEECEVTLAQPLRGAPAGLPPSASWAEDGGYGRLTVSREELNAALAALLAEGAAIAEVRSRRLSLEEFFVRRIGRRGWEVEE
ncbi:MAG: ABC transporter ATP-binding protein [Actinomycetota bacterium]|nr:ABC transporter ATP-binding protein [Actinomycetota bacterium]